MALNFTKFILFIIPYLIIHWIVDSVFRESPTSCFVTFCVWGAMFVVGGAVYSELKNNREQKQMAMERTKERRAKKLLRKARKHRRSAKVKEPGLQENRDNHNGAG